jgi:hypothetical protein
MPTLLRDETAELGALKPRDDHGHQSISEQSSLAVGSKLDNLAICTQIAAHEQSR